MSKTVSDIRVGDIVGIVVPTYNRDKELIGTRVAVKGQVKRIGRIGRGWWRADIYWEDSVKGFLYTGKNNWAWVRDLVLISRPESNYHGRK